ncbi:hypothetical protein BGZ65_002448 [Modicella reniformis]|uniref:Uncharacterized protein n=1 Tax=Modicella reniformis TaxID=1440133 RepID=A0A9P6J645_9FUNG|nr:hypothetical protein BGZ65_002448 [Modicella reniformis]
MQRNPGNQKPSFGSTVGTPTLRRPAVSSPSNNSLSISDIARKKHARKDDAIRKKLDQELGKKGTTTRIHGSTRPVQGTVGSLRPSPALTLPDTSMVVDAARIMAAKRADAVLVIDATEQTLVGIMTDKDLAFRVVAEGLDIHTPISEVMTKNPYCVTTDTNATEALNKMVSGGFRHLPCLNSDGDVVGLLDITKCLFEALEKLDKAHKSSKQLADALQGMQTEWAQPANPELQSYIAVMKEKMSSPDLNVILDEHHGVAEIHTKTTVREASRVMKQCHTTACLIMEDKRIAGIFTTKVPNWNNWNEDGRLAGLVDVLQVSFAMLNQMSTMQGESDTPEGQGPVWNRFWESTFAREETGSEVSVSDVRSGVIPPPSETNYGGGSTMNMSVRRASPVTPPSELEEVGSEFTFKFQGSNEQVHRFGSSTRSFTELYNKIVDKIGRLEPGTDITLSYCDEEGDQVLILKDEDITEAVQMAFRNQWQLIRLSVAVSSKNQKNGGAIPSPETRSTPSAEEPGAGLNPILVSGAVGLGVGAILVFALSLMKK